MKSIQPKRVVLITGGSSKIGSEIALGLASQGISVALHYFQNSAGALATKRKILSNGDSDAEIFKADLTSEYDTYNLITAVKEKFGQIDILINNAGAAYEYKAADQLSTTTLRDSLAINTVAPFILMKELFPAMEKNGWGRIVSISTVAISYLGFQSVHYTAAKSALETITLAYAKNGAKCNVLVNVIRCGLIDTEMKHKISGYAKNLWEARLKLVPVGRAGQPYDVFTLVNFLVSSENNFITKQVISVSGGD